MDNLSPIYSKRDSYYDFLKGIAIIMVVGIHSFTLPDNKESLTTWVLIFFRQLLNCAVPLFLALSGFFAARKEFLTQDARRKFYAKSIKRVYIPLLVWGTGWFLLDLWKHPISGYQIIKSLGMLLTGGYSVYYFVALIIQCYLLTPWLSRKLDVAPFATISACVGLSAIAITFTTYFLNVLGYDFPLLLYAGPLYVWIVFFALGMFIAKYRTPSLLKVGVIVTILGYVLSCLETTYYLQLTGKGIGIKLSSFIFSAGVIMFLLSPQVKDIFSESRLTRIISYIGEVSFGVYLIHMYVVTAIGITTDFGFLLSWGIALIGTILIVYACQKTLRYAFTRKWLGIG